MNASIASKYRVAVIDDHGIVRFGYSEMIKHVPDIEICGMAGSEQEGFELLKRERPDLAIIDLSLGKGDGMELIQSILKLLPKLKVLVISAHDESLFAHRVLALGARGYLNKQEAPEKLLDGIEALLKGEFFFSTSVTRTLINGRLGNSNAGSPDGVESLTNRELQVFGKIGSGQSTREIAEALFLSIKTIDRHKENIKRKLKIENATQLVKYATEWVIRRGY